MKRTELIEILRSKIKTLKCADFNTLEDDLRKDESGNPIPDSILVSETKIRPWKISGNYGIGIETEYWGQKLISKKDKGDGFKMCGLSITDYKACGNYHCYGEVNVNHATWENVRTGSHTLSTELGFTKDGRWHCSCDGECIIFPAKDQRDWNKFDLTKTGK